METKQKIDLVLSHPNKAYLDFVKNQRQGLMVQRIVNLLMEGETYTTQKYQTSLQTAMINLILNDKI